MRDPFARVTARDAHTRATEASKDAAEAKALLRSLIGKRPPRYIGSCSLCGEPARGRYCHAHSWAA